MKQLLIRLRTWLTPRRLLRLGGELLLLLIFLLAVEAYLTRDAARGPAPELAATLSDGRAFELAQLRGAPALVYFWGTWCPVCRAEQGAIDGLAQDVPLLTVAMQSGTPGDVNAYLAARGLRWTTVADESGGIARQWGVSGVPAVFVLDGDGEIRFVTRGYTTELGLRLRLWWVHSRYK
ncbi:MAG: protein disulfide oxidoreductase [Gammaproteobacteria bacterium HGW-Gammaproteobacteria-1]|jgi:peroxiredoxin|nr:MAG: protein disulfide oxidoreductase [Gammaproteobacteria bacterium HGW-Gammaproteobacteria-1]